VALATLALAAPALAQGSPPLNALRDLGPALNNCLKAPPLENEAEITIWFSLKRDGSINGRPRIAFDRAEDENSRRSLAKAVIEGLYACTPLHLTPGLGGAVAGRVFSFRFFVRPHQGARDT